MGTLHELANQRKRGTQVAVRASIALGIGDDDTVDTLTESEHDTESSARAWVERELPRAQFPEWVTRRRHGTAGAFLYGQIEHGWHVEDPEQGDALFEPDLDAPGWDADLVDGAVHWRPSP